MSAPVRPTLRSAIFAVMLLAPATQACADGGRRPIAAAGGHTPPTAEAKTPDEHVRRFYAWYLGELRAGRQPFDNAGKMRAYASDGAIGEWRSHALPGFDPALALPKPQSDWSNMKVTVGKPHYYHEAGVYDAYVEVGYSGFTDRQAHSKNGTHFVGIVDLWSIGLSRTASGWRIASIGVETD
jgi:hypothetical protein